jgi:hypothetical protein
MHVASRFIRKIADRTMNARFLLSTIAPLFTIRATDSPENANFTAQLVSPSDFWRNTCNPVVELE